MNDIKDEIKGRLTEYVQSITAADPRAGRDKYACPLCGSGTGEGGKSDGAFSIYGDGVAWKCFSCGKGGDIFELIGFYENMPDFKDQYKRACEVLGYTNNQPIKGPGTAPERPTRPLRAKRDQTPEERERALNGTLEGRNKVSSLIEQSQKNREQAIRYFSRRGLNAEIVDKFKLGYCPGYYMPSAGENRPSVIMPYGGTKPYFMARSTLDKHFHKPKAELIGVEPLFNPGALETGEPVFICEAPIDAMSIEQEGGHAVATGGTSHNNLVAALKGGHVSPLTLIVAFDEDEPGQEATAKLDRDIQTLKASGYAADVVSIKAKWSQAKYEKNKDVNDRLLSDVEQLRADIKANIERAKEAREAFEASRRYEIDQDSGSVLMLQLFDKIEREKNNADDRSVKTGFKDLDDRLDGGLYPGLYIMGAISSMGKTAFALQIADNIAKQGRDVLIFSLEMSKEELIGRSLSRLTYTINKDSNGADFMPKTTRQIITPRKYQRYNQDEIDLINDAARSYQTNIGDHIFIKEGFGDYTIETIRNDIEQHKAITGNVPVVLIDYLQIIAPEPDLKRATDKQITDKAVLELKRISRDETTPVIAISSFNRDNYAQAVSMSSFKESGAIEYGSDVLLALQPKGMKYAKSDGDKKGNKEKVDDNKRSDVRDLEAVILKNRNGPIGEPIPLKYYAKFNYFELAEQIDLEASLAEWKENKGFSPFSNKN